MGRFARFRSLARHRVSYFRPLQRSPRFFCSCPGQRQKEGQDEAVFVTLVGMGTNLSLVILKGVCGFLGGSTAMMSDAVHSLTDSVSDVMVYFALRISARSPDRQFPWGYGKFDSAGAGFVGIMLLATGVGISYHSVLLAMSNELMIPTNAAVVGALGSIIVKEALYQITVKAGEKSGSQATIANAWHHRSDALSSGVALVGILGAMAGYPILDPLAGFAISLFICKVGWEFTYSSMQDLLDRSCEESISEVKTSIEKHGFQYVKDVRIRKCGPHVIGDVKLLVAPEMSMSEWEDLTNSLSQKIRQDVPSCREINFLSETRRS